MHIDSTLFKYLLAYSLHIKQHTEPHIIAFRGQFCAETSHIKKCLHLYSQMYKMAVHPPRLLSAMAFNMKRS